MTNSKQSLTFEDLEVGEIYVLGTYEPILAHLLYKIERSKVAGFYVEHGTKFIREADGSVQFGFELLAPYITLVS